jgi:pyruvate dehydrogenase E1 component alpha subunit
METREVSRALMAVAKTKEADQIADAARPAAAPAAQNGPIADFSKEQEFQALRLMLLIRRFEEKAGQMYGMGLIGGFCQL